MKPVRVKICGISSVDDALAAALFGADAIGLVFYPPSPRHVSIEQASNIVNKLPPFISVVALFVDPEPEFVKQVLGSVSIDMLQFHGNESESFCQQFKKPWMKALRVKDAAGLQVDIKKYPGANALLLDTYVEGQAGGTGQCFDWSILPPDTSQPWILAGGLNPENLQQALNQTAPYAVDVSGGVECDGRKGVKDHNKIKSFIEIAKQASR